MRSGARAGVQYLFMEGFDRAGPGVVLPFQTTLDRLPALQQRVRELHPYEVPEIIALPILGGNPAYLEWIRREVHAEPGG